MSKEKAVRKKHFTAEERTIIAYNELINDTAGSIDKWQHYGSAFACRFCMVNICTCNDCPLDSMEQVSIDRAGCTTATKTELERALERYRVKQLKINYINGEELKTTSSIIQDVTVAATNRRDELVAHLSKHNVDTEKK